MTDLTDYARNMLGRALCGRLPVLPSAVYLGLGTGADAQGLHGEPASKGYTRQKVTFNGTGQQRSSEPLNFVFQSAIGRLSHLGLFDAAYGGNPLFAAPLSQPVDLTGPGTVTIAATSLTVLLD